MDAELVEAAVRRESNDALARGSLVAVGLGIVGGLSVLLTGIRGPLIVPPLAFGLTAATFALLVYVLARAGRVHGAVAWAVMLTFVSLPTAFFVLAQFVTEAGAATYLNGPIAWVYFVVVAVSGTLFRPRLSIVVGIVAAAGYGLAYALAWPRFAELRGHPDVLPDLQEASISGIRMVILVASGFIAGGLATLGRRLTMRALAEQRDKENVSRLLGEYVSEEVKTKLLAAPLAEAGERKRVVILFSDVRGFTHLSEGAEPEAIVLRLNEYFDGMVEAIAKQGGVVDKFVGDAVMAVFGGVVELDDPDSAAVRAAIGMREKLAELRVRWEGQAIAPFDNGIGIHAGEVLMGAIGAAHRKDFTVIGDAVNTASRIEGLCKDEGCPILVSDAVRARLSSELAARCEPLGERAVKGRAAPIAIHRIRV
ncbi:MAG: adenylate/guanylate cyclase domain-containing protein [Sandaracinaceae bacterium]